LGSSVLNVVLGVCVENGIPFKLASMIEALPVEDRGGVMGVWSVVMKWYFD